MPNTSPILSPRLSPLASLSPLSLSPRLHRRKAPGDDRVKGGSPRGGAANHAELTLTRVSQHTLSHYSRDKKTHYGTPTRHSGTLPKYSYELGQSEGFGEEEEGGGISPLSMDSPPGLVSSGVSSSSEGPPGLVQRHSEGGQRRSEGGSPLRRPLSPDWEDQPLGQSEDTDECGEGESLVVSSRMNKQAEMLRLAGTNCPSLSGLKGRGHRSDERRSMSSPRGEREGEGDGEGEGEGEREGEGEGVGEGEKEGEGEGEEMREEGEGEEGEEQNEGFESSLEDSEGAQKFNFEECTFEIPSRPPQNMSRSVTGTHAEGKSLGEILQGKEGKDQEQKKRLLQMSGVGEVTRDKASWNDSWTPSGRRGASRRGGKPSKKETDNLAVNIGGPRLGSEPLFMGDGEGEGEEGGETVF